MSEGIKSNKETIGFRLEGLRGLSSTATRFLQQHPKEARMVVSLPHWKRQRFSMRWSATPPPPTYRKVSNPSLSTDAPTPK